MTEAEWLTCTDPDRMLSYLRGNISDRKLRLFAVGCCRRVWHLLNEDQGQRAVEVAEQCADGLLTVEEAYGIGHDLNLFHNSDLVERLARETGVYWEAINAALFSAGLTTGWLDTEQASNIARKVAGAVALQALSCDFGDDIDAFGKAAGPLMHKEHAVQARILRDIVCNPFRPISVDPGWLTSGVLALAHAIYKDRPLDRMPALADAFEESGCKNANVLTHCRRPEDHVRGCWVLDLILGKT